MNLSKFKSEEDAAKAFDVIIKGRKMGLCNSDLAYLIKNFLKDNVEATALLLKNLQRDLRESSERTTPTSLLSAQFYLRMRKKKKYDSRV